MFGNEILLKKGKQKEMWVFESGNTGYTSHASVTSWELTVRGALWTNGAP